MSAAGPPLCTACGFATTSAAATCARCGATAEGVLWTEVARSSRKRALETLSAIALWAVSPWGLVLAWMLARTRPDSPTQWMLWTLLCAITAVLIVGGGWLAWNGCELCFHRDWSFRTVDDTRRGAARTLFGRLVRGRAEVTIVDGPRPPQPLRALGSASIGYVGELELWRAFAAGDAPLVRELASGPGERRPSEIALVGVVLGLVARGRVGLRLERHGGWVKTVGAVRPLPARYAVTLGAHVLTVEQSCPLERALLDHAPLGLSLEDAIAGALGPRVDPWRHVHDELVAAAPEWLAVDLEALAGPLRELAARTPETLQVVWSAVERGLLKSAMAAHTEWHFPSTKSRPSPLPN